MNSGHVFSNDRLEKQRHMNSGSIGMFFAVSLRRVRFGKAKFSLSTGSKEESKLTYRSEETIMEMNSIADWEEWVKLARQNPEKFERERKAAIEELIMSQPAQYRHRSRQLQWKIDAVRQTSPNALSSCIRIYDMLMDSFYGPSGLLNAINLLGNADGEADRVNCPIKAGRCIEFQKKRTVDPGA